MPHRLSSLSRGAVLWLAISAPAFLVLSSGCSTDNPESTPPPSFTPASDYGSGVATRWLTKTYDLVKSNSLSPASAARVYGYTTVALYQAVVPGMPHYRSLSGILNELGSVPSPDPAVEYHWPSTSNSAIATLLRSLLPEASAAAVTDFEGQIAAEYHPSLPPGVGDRSVQYGILVGTAIYNWSLTDGYVTLHNCAYTPPTGEGLWEPTPPAFAAPLEPCWGQMRPFVLLNSDECLAAAHTPYGNTDTGAFHAQAMEVYDAVANCTPEQMATVNFWADGPGATGTPAGHSIMILTQILEQGNYHLETAAEAYLRVGVAVNDAFISCWRAKFVYNLCRPITYLRAYVDPNWSSLITTPNFPEYTSGHSVQSAAAARVLSNIFGDNFAFTDSTNSPARHFNSFDEAAMEAAMSRIYAGIHYRDAILNGLEQGHCVGARASALPLRVDS